jgi:hypothetical protein
VKKSQLEVKRASGHLVHPCAPASIRDAFEELSDDMFAKMFAQPEKEWPGLHYPGLRRHPPQFSGFALLSAFVDAANAPRLYVNAVPADVWAGALGDEFVGVWLPRTRTWLECEMAKSDIERTDPLELVLVLSDGGIQESELLFRDRPGV